MDSTDIQEEVNHSWRRFQKKISAQDEKWRLYRRILVEMEQAWWG